MSQTNVSTLLNGEKVVPVVVIESKAQALGLAQALVEGGINSIEITLRNSYAIQAIKDVKTAFPETLILAGTVCNVDKMEEVLEAGADGIVSPGVSESMLAYANSNNVPYLPGVATSSEIIAAMEHGLSECKLFPATVVGGVDALNAYAGPFHQIKFCPTGGIGASNYAEYLALDNVMCVGGSWVAPSKLIKQENWAAITELCTSLTV